MAGSGVDPPLGTQEILEGTGRQAKLIGSAKALERTGLRQVGLHGEEALVAGSV